MAKKISIIALIILLLIAVVAALYALLQPVLYKDYYAKARREFRIPGLNEGAIPQGFVYLEEEKLYLVTAYMTGNRRASCIYILDDAGSLLRRVEMLDEQGNPYLGHPGGITVGEQLIWIANDGEGEDNCVWSISREELLQEQTRSVRLTQRFTPHCRAAFCTISNGILWVGEYQYSGFYEVDPSHTLTSPRGETNPAIICGYAVDESAPGGIGSQIPVGILSICRKVQGIAFSQSGRIALSVTYSPFISHLDIHENVLAQAPEGSFCLEGHQIPLWYLDSSNCQQSINAPPLTEELAVKDGRMYIMYESATFKYWYGYLTRGLWVYSYPFE